MRGLSADESFHIQRLPAVGAESCVGSKHRTAAVTAEMFFPVAVIQGFAEKPHTAVGTYALLAVHHHTALHDQRTINHFEDFMRFVLPDLNTIDDRSKIVFGYRTEESVRHFSSFWRMAHRLVNLSDSL